jgi:hypothetical protein
MKYEEKIIIMTTDKLEYWTKFSLEKMEKDGETMPTVIVKVLEMEEFENSGISEDQLRQSIKERIKRKVFSDKIRAMKGKPPAGFR